MASRNLGTSWVGRAAVAEGELIGRLGLAGVLALGARVLGVASVHVSPALAVAVDLGGHIVRGVRVVLRAGLLVADLLLGNRALLLQRHERVDLCCVAVRDVKLHTRHTPTQTTPGLGSGWVTHAHELALGAPALAGGHGAGRVGVDQARH